MEPLVVRDQHLESLSHFSARLAGALSCAGAPTGEELTDALQGECVQCGIQINGRELLQLSEPVEKPEDTSKLGRLRFAYCGRKGCKSYFYKLKFFAHPQFDWPSILLHADKSPEVQSPEEIAHQQSVEAAKRAIRRQFKSRIAAGVAAAVVLVLLFQWYNGGTIPLIRTPEKFTVDPMPQMSRLNLEE